MYSYKLFIALLLSVTLVGSLMVGRPAKASNFDEREAAIKSAQEEIARKQEANREALNKTQNEIAAFSAQSNSIQAQLDFLLEQNIASTEEYERLTRELEVARDEMNKSITRYEEAQQFADDKQIEYETRIVTLFKYRNKSVFEILLTSESLGGFFTNMRLMDYITSADNLMLEELKTAQEDAEVAKEQADQTVKQAKDYFDYAEEQLELLRNDIELTEVDLSSVEAELLNRSYVASNLETEYNQMDAELEAYYAELQAIENARATEAASIAESQRISASIEASQQESRRIEESIAESVRASQERERWLQESRAEEARAAEAARNAQEASRRESERQRLAWESAEASRKQATATTKAPATQAPAPVVPDVPAASSNYLMWPLASYNSLSSHYGPRVHPITGNPTAFHYGTDFAAGFGTPVRATLDGTVVIANASWQGQNYTSHKSGHGNYVTIQHANGLTSTYAHLKYVAVSVGQVIKQGQYIGQVGSTGASTGAHLHFEMASYGSTFNTWSNNWLLHPNSIR